MLRGNQHGFIRSRSCQTNLVVFYDQVAKSLDAGVAVDLVFLDFWKAFDTVSHPVLIKKLGNCGVDTYTVRGVTNWLEGRPPESGSRLVLFNLAECGQWHPYGLSPRACTIQHLHQQLG